MLDGRPSSRVCSVLPKVPPEEAIRLQRSSDVLLLFNLTSSRARGGTLSYPSKVFEYLAAGRPVLCVPGDGDWVDTLVGEAAAGASANSPEEVHAVLSDWYQAWRRDGRVPYAGRPDAVSRYSQRRLAQRIAETLDRAAGAGAT